MIPDVLQFDNSYSWVSSKTVHYDVEVLDPDEDVVIRSNHDFVMKHQLRHSVSSQSSKSNAEDSEVTHL